MRLNLNEFLTDDDIHTLWGIAGRIIDSGAIIDNQDYEISLSLLTDEPNSYYESLSEGKDDVNESVTEKEFYIETKHYVYVDYTIRARDKEHALEQFENGAYDDIDTDYGVYDEQIVKVTEENTEQQLSLAGVF